MWTALLFGAVSSSALIIGAVIGVRFRIPKRLLAMLLAFAAGAVIAALADTNMPEAFEHGGPAVALSTAAGFVLSFVLSLA